MRPLAPKALFLPPLLTLGSILACGPSAGGSVGVGGSPLTGGSSGSGGTPSGGTLASGGSAASGGAGLVGGTASGGALNTTGGASPGGGAQASGGALPSGGNSSGGNSSGGGETGGAASGGGDSGDPCGSASLCDDFEDGMDAGWSIQPNSTPAPEVDKTKGANGSTSSLKVSVTSQQSFVVAVPPAESFYVRTYMMLEKPTAMVSGHGWFIVGADSTSQGSGSQMRFGASTNHGHPETDFNVYGDTCGGEKTHFSDGANDAKQGWTNPTDEVLNLDANKWYCVEAYFNGDADEFQLFVDEKEHEGFHVTAAKMCDGWSPEYKYIKLGGGANGNLGNVWYDDVVISTTRPHCKSQ